jgi:hypothetical protein
MIYEIRSRSANYSVRAFGFDDSASAANVTEMGFSNVQSLGPHTRTYISTRRPPVVYEDNVLELMAVH